MNWQKGNFRLLFWLINFTILKYLGYNVIIAGSKIN